MGDRLGFDKGQIGAGIVQRPRTSCDTFHSQRPETQCITAAVLCGLKRQVKINIEPHYQRSILCQNRKSRNMSNATRHLMFHSVRTR